jgi:hypothetical protein
MPDRSSKRKRPADLNRLAASIARAATEGDPQPKNAAAVKARATKLSKKRRSEIATKAAHARWHKQS